MKARWIVLAVVVSLVLGSTAVLAAERNQTLIVGGGTWSQATSWNPLYPNCANGIRGLVYETLFAYSPLTNEHKPWLAESGGWFPTMFTKSNCAATFISPMASPSQQRMWSSPTNWPVITN